MLNNLLFFIVIILCNINSNAQNIMLEKLNSLERISINLPGKINIKYQSDSIKWKQKVKVLDYHFPILTVMKNKNDTILLNVSNILSMKTSTPIKNTTLVFSSLVTSLITVVPIKEVIRGDVFLLLLVIPSGYVTYLSITNIGTKYNTKTKWSFY